MRRRAPFCCLVLALGAALPGRAAGDPPAPTTAWGKPVEGVQAGIRVGPDGNTGARALDLEVVVRNVGRGAVELDHLQLAFGGNHADGTVTLRGVEVYGSYLPKGYRIKATLAAGETHRVASVPVYWPGEGFGFPAPRLRPGENRVGAEEVVVRLAGGKEVELATGYLDVRITPPK
jgi:hypothetical protein